MYNNLSNNSSSSSSPRSSDLSFSRDSLDSSSPRSSVSSNISNSTNSSSFSTPNGQWKLPEKSNKWATFKDYPLIPYINYKFIFQGCTSNKSQICTYLITICMCLIIIPSILIALIFSYVPTSVDWKIGVVCYNVFLLLCVLGLYFYIGKYADEIQVDIDNDQSEKNKYDDPNKASDYELFNTRSKLWMFMLVIFIILLSLLGKFFGGLSILILVFALGLVALLLYGFYKTFEQVNIINNSGTNSPEEIAAEKNMLYTWSTGCAILGTFIFIAMLLGIFILVFPPKNDPNNPTNAYNNVLTIIYVLLGIIGLMVVIGGVKYISENAASVPIFVSNSISYFYTLFPSIIGIILYMSFMTYFYNYGGLLTLFAKKNHDGTYDNSVVNGKPTNPESLNKAVHKINTYKNKAMIVLAPITICIGLYILYQMKTHIGNLSS